MGTTTRRSDSVTRRSPSPSISTNHNKTSDIVVEVDGVGFALHKFSLSSRSGRIKKLVKSYGGPDPSRLALPNLPGGADAFELAAKFCYGIKFEINATNVALLRCVAEYLEMTEEYGVENLVACTEKFLQEAVFKSLKESVQVLCSCQRILAAAEDVKITSRCIDAIASNVCNSYTEHRSSGQPGKLRKKLAQNAIVEWWADELLPLPVDLFQLALLAMKSKGLATASIVGALMQYAHQSLKPLNTIMGEQCEQKEQQGSISIFEHGQRIILETIVNLLPAEKGLVPASFLFGLLRTALLLDTTVACRMDIERRIGAQLEHATLEELLFPSLSHVGDTLFDVDFVHRLLVNFLQQDENDDLSNSHHSVYESDGLNSPSQGAIMKVAKLIDTYLAEVAADANLKASKFINLSELLPNHARAVDDGIYRAIDIYLKAHPTISDIERRKICKLMDCQKLSQEACSHAAQNERLPVHIMVQVLYFEQLRLRTALSGSFANGEPLHPPLYTSQRMGSSSVSRTLSPRENYASLRQENEDLKLEVTRMTARLNNLEKHHINNKCVVEKTSSAKKFLISVSRTFNRINPFARNSTKDGSKQQESQVKASRRRRNSIS